MEPSSHLSILRAIFKINIFCITIKGKHRQNAEVTKFSSGKANEIMYYKIVSMKYKWPFVYVQVSLFFNWECLHNLIKQSTTWLLSENILILQKTIFNMHNLFFQLLKHDFPFKFHKYFMPVYQQSK